MTVSRSDNHLPALQIVMGGALAVTVAVCWAQPSRTQAGERPLVSLSMNGSDTDAGRHIKRTAYAAAVDLSLRNALPPMGAESPEIGRDKVAILIETVPLTPSDDQEQTESKRALTDLARADFAKALQEAAAAIQTNPNDPVGYNLQGGAYLGQKDYAAARKSFEKALSLQPDNGVALLYLAQLDVAQNAIASARKRYEVLLAKDPRNVDAMTGMALLEARTGNEKGQIAWLEKAKAARPDALAARLLLGSYYLRSGNYPKALAELTDALQSRPKDPELLDLLGQAQLADGQKSQAVVTYQTLVSVRPESPLAQYRLAMAQINAQDFAGSADSLRRALELKQDYVEAAFALGALEVRRGRHAEAIKLARQLQTSLPKSPAGYAMEGDVLTAQERYADAVKAYEKAFEIGQTGPLAVKVHAAQTKAGDAKQADATLQQWLKSHPDDIEVRHYLAGENLRSGQNKLAIEQYQLILKKDPKNLLALNNLANVYQTEKDSRARGVAEQAYKLMPTSAMIADTLGWILVEQGKTARGLELVRQAADKDPKNLEVRYHLAVALAKSGDKPKARQELETLLSGDQKFPQREAAQLLLQQLSGQRRG